jgi:hypothetical protein
MKTMMQTINDTTMAPALRHFERLLDQVAAHTGDKNERQNMKLNTAGKIVPTAFDFFQEGKSDFQSGETLSDCPHPPAGHKARAWRKGWKAAQKTALMKRS